MARPINVNCHDIRDVRRALADINAIVNELVAVSFADISAIGNPDGYIVIFDGSTGTQIIQSGSKVDAAGNFTLVGGINGLAIPSTNFVGVDDVQTLTNKTLTTPTIGSLANATHSHQNAAGGGTLNASAIASGTIATARLGSGTANSSTILFGDSTWGAVPAGYTDEQAQDAVGAMVDSSLNYVDGTPLLQRAALTGDVTASAGSNSTTIANDAVTYAKMQNVSATDRLLGRDTASAGDVEELTVGGGVEFTGSGGIQRSALTGDVTASAGNNATTIANNAVTYAKIQAVTASRLLGNDASGTACEELTPDATEFGFGSATVKLQNKVVGRILRIIQPATLYAAEDVRVGGSTPAENFPVWNFDASTDEYLDFYCQLDPCYAGRGLTVRLAWAAATATSGNCIWRAAIRAFVDDTDDIDVSHTYDYNSITVAAASASGEVVYDDITFTNGSDMDSLAAGEFFILRVTRDADNASDTMTGDAQLVAVSIRETN